MELIEVLRHRGLPRGDYAIAIPSQYGKLTLDVLGPVENVLAATQQPPAQDREEADKLLRQAGDLSAAGNREAAAGLLLGFFKRWPVALAAPLSLFELYAGADNLAEAEYWLKQAIALQPGYSNLAMLARLLGRMQRYDEALLLHDHLWQTRGETNRDEALSASRDYLVTLGRVPDGVKMVAVAEQALAAFGPDSALTYQRLLGLLLSERMPEARVDLAAALAQIAPDDPLYPRFEQLQAFIAGKYPLGKDKASWL